MRKNLFYVALDFFMAGWNFAMAVNRKSYLQLGLGIALLVFGIGRYALCWRNDQ